MANFFDPVMIDRLIATVRSYGVSELEIEDGERKLKIKSASTSIENFRPEKTIKLASTPVVIPEEKTSGSYIKAPLSGVFYASPSPESPPFVKVGQSVNKGDALCIIEAMKMMNEIGSEFSGTIKNILVSNEEPVELGQPIFLISAE